MWCGAVGCRRDAGSGVDLDVFSGGSGDVVHLAARRLEVEQAGHLDVLDSFIYIPGAVYLPPSAWVPCRVVFVQHS